MEYPSYVQHHGFLNGKSLHVLLISVMCIQRCGGMHRSEGMTRLIEV